MRIHLLWPQRCLAIAWMAVTLVLLAAWAASGQGEALPTTEAEPEALVQLSLYETDVGEALTGLAYQTRDNILMTAEVQGGCERRAGERHPPPGPGDAPRTLRLHLPLDGPGLLGRRSRSALPSLRAAFGHGSDAAVLYPGRSRRKAPLGLLQPLRQIRSPGEPARGHSLLSVLQTGTGVGSRRACPRLV